MAKNKKQVYISHIKEIELKGYKSISNLKTELNKGLNILIGANGAGKSNFLECINYSLRRFDETVFLNDLKIVVVDNKGEEYEWSFEKEKIGNVNFDNVESRKRHIKREIFLKGNKILLDAKINKSFLLKNSLTNIDTEFLKPIYYILGNLSVEFNQPTFVGFGMPFYEEFLEKSYSIKIAINKEENKIYNNIDFGHYDNNRLRLNFNHIFSKFLNKVYENFGLKVFVSQGRSVAEITNKLIYECLEIDHTLKEKLRKYSPIQDIRFFKKH